MYGMLIYKGIGTLNNVLKGNHLDAVNRVSVCFSSGFLFRRLLRNYQNQCKFNVCMREQLFAKKKMKKKWEIKSQVKNDERNQLQCCCLSCSSVSINFCISSTDEFSSYLQHYDRFQFISLLSPSSSWPIQKKMSTKLNRHSAQLHNIVAFVSIRCKQKHFYLKKVDQKSFVFLCLILIIFIFIFFSRTFIIFISFSTRPICFNISIGIQMNKQQLKLAFCLHNCL